LPLCRCPCFRSLKPNQIFSGASDVILTEFVESRHYSTRGGERARNRDCGIQTSRKHREGKFSKDLAIPREHICSYRGSEVLGRLHLSAQRLLHRLTVHSPMYEQAFRFQARTIPAPLAHHYRVR
jgi:hypothetical protein